MALAPFVVGAGGSVIDCSLSQCHPAATQLFFCSETMAIIRNGEGAVARADMGMPIFLICTGEFAAERKNRHNFWRTHARTIVRAWIIAPGSGLARDRGAVRLRLAKGRPIAGTAVAEILATVLHPSCSKSPCGSCFHCMG